MFRWGYHTAIWTGSGCLIIISNWLSALHFKPIRGLHTQPISALHIQPISVLDFQCSCTSVLQRDSNVVQSKFNRIHQKYTVLLTPLLALFGHGFIRGQWNSTGHTSTKCFAWYLWMVEHAKCCQLFLDQIFMWSICYPAFMSVFNGACSNPISAHCSHAYVWHVHCVCMVALSRKLRFTR